MGVRVTDEAMDVLRRSLQLGGLDAASAGIRLRGAHGLGGSFDVQVELADGPLEGEEVIEAGDIKLFVGREVGEVYGETLVTVEPQHDVVVVRPDAGPGDSP